MNASTAGINRVGHGDEDGLETLDNWQCQPGCPVAALDEQSGSLTSGKAPEGGLRRNTDKQRAVFGAFAGQTIETATLYGDTGGASRYFKQVHEPAEMMRASPDFPCPVCNMPYGKHPYDHGQLGYDGKPFLQVACGGRRIKT